ncbi:MAG: hypothetical protein QOF40_1073 [Actinomycetota bacterium]|nr:hypothetical protein [Actinomycetota bacterium]
MSDVALCADVADAAAHAERAHADLVRVIGVWNARAAWAEDGSLSAAAWLSANTAMTRVTAVRMCATARLVHAHEQTAKALEAGDVTVAHVEVLASAVRRREELYPEHEETLINTASTLSPDDLVRAARRWRSLADDELAAIDAASSHEQRYLHVSPTMGGGKIDGFLDPTATATLIEALDARVPPDPADSLEPPRALSVRRADALLMLAEQSLHDPEGGGRAEPSINLTMDLDTLLGDVTTDLCDARCDLEHYGPVGRAIAMRLACDAKVARIVMRGKTRVLDLGRSTRVVSPALRKAVMLRDERCQFGRCRAPAKWCDVHHVVHWLDGGETNEDNLVLLCRRHHAATHEGGWRLTRGPDGIVTTHREHPQRHRGRRRTRAPARAGP